MRRSLFQKMLTVCALMTLVSSMVGVAHAAGITRFTLALSDQTVLAETDHTVTFVTPSGVDNPADTIIMTYGADADLTALSFPRDMDLAVDDDSACDGPFTEQVLEAVASSGAWGCAIAGNNITCTPPTDAGPGTVPADRCIQVQVGTNATEGAAGAAQIINPDTGGELRLTIGGGFGDSGSAVSVIVDSDTVSVGAIVCHSDGACVSGRHESDETLPSDADTTPPNIFNVLAVPLTNTTARISWNTDDVADRGIVWGNTRFLDRTSQVVSEYGYSHTFELSGLTPGQTYEVTLRSKDMVGNEATYGPVEFIMPDGTPPVILDPQATAVTNSSAVIQWLTDELSDSYVEYGTTASYGYVAEDVELVADHAVLLSGLASGTTYHFRVTSTDVEGNTATSGDVVFTTDIDVAPLNVVLTVTPGDTINTLKWELPSDPDLAGVRMVYRTDRFPSDPYDGTLVYNTLGTVFYHEGLTNGVTYYYGLFAYDVAGNVASGTLGYGTPVGTTGGGSLTLPAETKPTTTLPSSSPSTGSISQPSQSTPLGSTTGTTFPATGVGQTSEDTESQGEPVIETSPDTSISLPTVGIYVGGETIQLDQGFDGVYHVLSGRPFTVGVDVGEAETTGISAEWLGGRYNVTQVTRGSVASGALVGPVVTTVYGHVTTLESSETGTVQTLTITVAYADGTIQTLPLTLYIEPLGQTFEVLDGEKTNISGPSVTLYQRHNLLWEVWDSTSTAQSNPTKVSEDGFAWYVPNGVYDVRVEWNGFLDARSGTITVTDHLVHPTIELTRAPLAVGSIVDSNLPADEKMVQVIWATLDQAKAFYQQLRMSPLVESITPSVQATLGLSLLLSAVFLTALMQSSIRHGRLLVAKIEERTCRPISYGDTDPYGRAEFSLPEAGTYVVSVEVAETESEQQQTVVAESAEEVEVVSGSWIVVDDASTRYIRLAPGMLYALQPHRTKRSIDLVHQSAKLSFILASFLFALAPEALSVVLLSAAATFAFAEHHWLHKHALQHVT